MGKGKKLLLAFTAFIFLGTTFAMSQSPTADASRAKYNFNSDWRLHVGQAEGAEEPGFDDSGWEDVSLPYGWNEDEAFKNDIKDLSTGIAWYRKHFKLPDTHQDKKVFIEFEGVRQAAEVYVNGEYIGIHENGVTAFGFDISDHVHFGDRENVIAVKTDNSWDYREQATGETFRWSDRNFYANYGGINKNVNLHVTGKIYQTLPLYSNLKTTGQYIHATDINIPERSATVTAQTQVRNETDQAADLEYEVKIENLEGELVKSIPGGTVTIPSGQTKVIEASERVDDLNFWSWGYGYLYAVKTILKRDGQVIDEVDTRTGFRKTEFGNGLIKINGRVMQVHGYAQRTTNEWPTLGINLPPWVSDFSNRLMVEGNANLVRWMHVTPSKQDVKSLDRLGLMQVMPAGDSEGDSNGRHWQQRLEAMRDAIIYNRNHPSIIFYEAGNDGISEEHMQDMVDLRDQYDPHGGRASGSREMLDSKVAEWGGEMLYINKSDDKPVWATEYMRDEALRKYWDKFTPPYHENGVGPLYSGEPAPAYNQNMYSYARNVVKRWYEYYRERPGTGDRVSSGGVNIIFSETNTHHRGTQNYRLSGEVDAMRLPEDSYFAHQVMWDGWVDPEQHGTHLIGHWDYVDGVKKEISVVSTGERVELKLNGESLGYGRREHGFLFTFDKVAWKPGTLTAITYNSKGAPVDSASLQTPGPSENINLTLHTGPNGVRADGTDLALVDVEIVDQNGQRIPTSLDMIQFELDGPAEWRGGIAQGPNNFILNKTLPVTAGINRVIVRSLTEAGEVTLRAKAKCECIKPAEISFTTSSIDTDNGLSLSDPARQLPVYLERGPTPSTPSFTVTRKSVGIAESRAGSNQEQAARSHDGRQTTSWSNEGPLEDAWIEYDLEKEAEVSEIALKLGGWRTSSYPIVISTQDSVLYRGITSPNLGFYYIEFDKPVETDHLKVRLFGKAEYDDKQYKLTEVTQNKIAREEEFQDTERLTINEIEIFEDP